jgi:plastocyanin
MLARFLACGLLVLCAVPSAAAQKVHAISLVRAGDNQFRFEPKRVTAKAGDVLEFTVGSGGPYVVGFQAGGLSPAMQARLDAAIPGRTGPLRGPVLGGKGDRFRVVVPDLPQGSYRFVSVTHLAYRMEGELVVR